MPTPWTKNVTSHQRSVLNRPACAKYLGAIVAAWSFAEVMLASYYAELICGAAVSGLPQPPGLWGARETFDLISNYRQRVNMIVAAAKRRHFDDSTIKELKKRLKALQDAGDERIIAAHGRWMVAKGAPHGLIWFKHTGTTEGLLYELTDFENCLKAIEAATNELHSFFWTTMRPRLEVDTRNFIAQIKAFDESKFPP